MSNGYSWDKNGNIVYDNPQPQLPWYEQVKRNLMAFGGNLDTWLNSGNDTIEKERANFGLGLATAPIGAGATLTANIAKPLVPLVGKKIGQSIASGVGSGLTGGAVEGFGRGLIEQENPLKTMAQDALLGGAFGGLGGYGLGKIAKGLEKQRILDNAENAEMLDNWFSDYVEGITNKTKPMAEYRGLKQGIGSGKQSVLLDQDSWHGTPFKGEIEKFDLNFMGSGEGAQMYGAGVYTAKNKDIANKHYRFIGEDIEPIKYKGKPLMSLYDNLERQANRLRPKEAQLFYDKMSLLEDLDYKGGLDDLDYFSPEVQNWYKYEIEPNLTMPGRLYRVQVPDNDVLLHSELPLNQQPEKVQKALRDMFLNQGVDIDDASNIYDMGTLNQMPYSEVPGQTLYNIINGLIDGNTTNRKATSKLFDEYGIKGIRAFGDRDGEIFVTFNPDNAKIVESYYPNKLYEKLSKPRQSLKNPKLSDKINYIDMMDDAEKARITSEFNTNLSKEQHKRKNIRKAVGNYYYTAKNNGFNNYEFTGRYLIDDLYR